MAKKSSTNRISDSGPVARKQASPGAQPSAALARVRLALAVGNVRGARSLAREIVTAGPDSERPEASGILERSGPDRRAVIDTLCVIGLIFFAAWAGIFRAH